MQRFPSESDIQKHGCCAIAMLADGGSESRAAELAKNGAVMATVTAMKSLPDDEDGRFMPRLDVISPSLLRLGGQG